MGLKSLFSGFVFGNILNTVRGLSVAIRHKFVKIRVYALVGAAGTGKSFRSHLIADKYAIPLIVDDGVLIKNMKIIAGSSAKFEDNVFNAIRRSVFEDDLHRNEVVEVLRREDFHRILILGTSIRMIDKIVARLFLPSPFKIIYITDVSTRQEMEKARISRQMGEHVVPAAAFEITSVKPSLLLDSIRVFFKSKWFFSRKKNYIRSIVRPHFHEEGVLSVSKSAVRQIIEHCVSEYDRSYVVYDLKIKKNKGSYSFKLFLDIPLGNNLLNNAEMLRNYIMANVLKYTVINMSTVDVIIHKFYDKGELEEINEA
ncbi:isopentenyl transferase family protein [Borrelia sp. BU AG58]|uniref:isopentenyl transferase family protein n=1 Tax=Borrelia sp. BU AG58 TaxID=2887345 RepID=UPI001E2C5BCF|nr:isopentenyl transferase family protein [Borrelia sp. BU AG58]UER67957.1 isopentenyl transferase family protein [Borrelia sp. BU AG58]